MCVCVCVFFFQQKVSDIKDELNLDLIHRVKSITFFSVQIHFCPSSGLWGNRDPKENKQCYGSGAEVGLRVVNGRAGRRPIFASTFSTLNRQSDRQEKHYRNCL